MKVTTSRHPQVPKDFSLAEGENCLESAIKNCMKQSQFSKLFFPPARLSPPCLPWLSRNLASNHHANDSHLGSQTHGKEAILDGKLRFAFGTS